MKPAHQFLRATVAALVAGLILGLLTFFLISTLGAGEPQAVEQTAAPQELTTASMTALEPLDPTAKLPETGALASTLDPIFSSGQGANISASVIDVATGDQVYSRSGDTPGIPASSLKVLTAIAATQAIGEDTRFTTKVVLKDKNTVVLIGGGDVLLGSGKGSEAVSGRAGLGSLASEAAAALVTGHEAGEVADSVDVQLDESLFPGESMNPAWDTSLLASHDISPISPVAMYGARADAGAKSARVSDPGLYAAQAFATALATATKTAGGPTIGADVTRAQSAAEGTLLGSVQSATVGEQLRFMLEVSDNYVAEAMGRLAAVASGEPGDYSHGAAAVERIVGELGIETTGAELLDTSGLAAGDRVAPRTLAAALAFAATSEHTSLRNLSYWLPVSGATGTMNSRLAGAETRGMVRAKTGSLMEVSSLTGLTVTQDGRSLAFSFLVNTNDRTIAPGKPVLDAAAAALRDCGCS